MTEHAGPQDTPPAEPGPRAAGHPAEPGAPAAPARPLPRDAGSWASKVDRLTETRVGFPAANVVGRRLTGPVQGFGKMWRKTYWMDIGAGISPQGGHRYLEGPLCRVLAGGKLVRRPR